VKTISSINGAFVAQMFFNKTDQGVDTFWQEYEEKIGEKVLARSLGKYISGWDEFDSNRWINLWGLIIVTGGGLRFHHFPQHHWMDTFSRNRGTPKEKLFFLPREKIISAKLIKETNWFLRLFKSPAPQFIVNYRDESEEEKKLFLEADLIHGDLVEALSA
jgi:hypothetical protein